MDSKKSQMSLIIFLLLALLTCLSSSLPGEHPIVVNDSSELVSEESIIEIFRQWSVGRGIRCRAAAHGSSPSSSLSLHTHIIHNSHKALFVWCLFIGMMVASFLLSSSCSCSQWWLPSSSTKAAGQCLVGVGGSVKSMAIPNNHPLCHLCGQLSSCFFSTSLHPAALPSLPFRERLRPSLQVLAKPFNHQSTKAHPCLHQRITSTRWSHTSHLKSVNACLWDTTFPFERIIHARSGMIHQASHQGLQHPLKRIFQVRQSLSEYLNMITSPPLFQESTHPGVAPALCSTIGTTPYFSMSLSLLVVRVQVALHL
ncbi:hypothetical protein NC652_027659 [Populus alba x Populus x berolinensis]|nr:hypothetical protein NC652_027659 [Populus alba x Populus x berolinensis]